MDAATNNEAQQNDMPEMEDAERMRTKVGTPTMQAILQIISGGKLCALLTMFLVLVLAAAVVVVLRR